MTAHQLMFHNLPFGESTAQFDSISRTLTLIASHLRGCVRVPIYHRLAADGHVSRRTIADALEVLHTLPDFSDVSYASARVQPLRLPSGDLVGLLQLAFTGSLPEVVYVVSLPATARFRAQWLGCAERRGGDIFVLDQAKVDGLGNVTLADGRLLQAVEVTPAYLPMTPSELDWRIVSYVIALTGQQDRCYRSLRQGVPHALQHMVPDLRFPDCSKLPGLVVPPLKVIAAYIADHDPSLRPSLQKIADALGTFGVRIPAPRPRRSQVCATI